MGDMKLPTHAYQIPGARWLRCDLHVHTPFDSAKKFGENVQHAIEAFRSQAPQKIAEIATRFIDACRHANDHGIDLVALTDHNSIDGYRFMRPTFETIRQQDRLQGISTPVVLPGVEFSVGGERPLHFLVIFAADSNPDAIEGAIKHVFGVRDPFDRQTGTPRASGSSVDDFLKKLYEYCYPTSGDRDLSCVVLPAHADSNSGVLQETASPAHGVAPALWDEMRGHLRQWVITRRDWHGFQTLRPYEKLPHAFQDLLAQWIVARRGQDWEQISQRERQQIRASRHWPLVEASDPHNYEAIGTRFTWLKMEIPDVEGIRLALLDPASRLRSMSEGKPATPYPYIRKVTIQQTDFFEDVEIPLNPSLNTMIGGRGTGKSTVIECLRYVLDRAHREDFADDESEVREAVENVLTRKPHRDFGDTAGMLLPTHRVEVELEVAGQSYRASRSAEGLQVVRGATEEEWNTGMSLDVRTLLEPRILSQRQIARIARDATAQRRELDALMPHEFMRHFAERRRTCLERLEALQVQRRALQERAATLPARETAFQTVKDQLAFLERGGNRDIIDQFRAYQSEQRWLHNVEAALQETVSRLATEADATDEARQRLGTPPDGPSVDWTKRVAAQVNEALTRARNTLEEVARSLRGLQASVEMEAGQAWRDGFQRAEAAYQALQVEMEERGVAFRQHERLLQQRALLAHELAGLRGVAKGIERLEHEIRQAHAALVSLHEERLAKRRTLARALEEQDADVRLDVRAFDDRKDVLAHREEWFAGAGVQDRDWELLVDFVFAPGGAIPDRFQRLVSTLRQDIEATQKLGRTLEGDDSAVAALLGGAAQRLTRNFFNALQRGERLQLDRMERFLPEDRVEARVRDPRGEFKPIEQGSIGLKSTAILSLLLSAGDQPLIIDQPEDDLDNQYVYDVVVDLLRKQKFSRQILIATHNANIPVNGDAELIVALGVENRLGQVVQCGSIDRREVKEVVSRIMEGSAEAFRLRRERYGF